MKKQKESAADEREACALLVRQHIGAAAASIAAKIRARGETSAKRTQSIRCWCNAVTVIHQYEPLTHYAGKCFACGNILVGPMFVGENPPENLPPTIRFLLRVFWRRQR